MLSLRISSCALLLILTVVTNGRTRDTAEALPWHSPPNGQRLHTDLPVSPQLFVGLRDCASYSKQPSASRECTPGGTPA